MTPRFVLSPRALADVDDIWAYTSETWGLDQAERYVRQLHRQIETVARAPKLGRACSNIRAGYFKFACGSHVIFYRLIDGGIEVIRILHERMDVERHV